MNTSEFGRRIGGTLLTIGLNVISPMAVSANPNVDLPIAALQENSELLDGNAQSVPVFVEQEENPDFSDLRRIDGTANLRSDTSTTSEVVTKLQPGSIVSQPFPGISVEEHEWFTTTVRFDGTKVITDTNAPKNNGYLREDVRGSVVDPATLPEELKEQIIKENLPPISLTGEYSSTQILKSLEGLGGQEGELNIFIGTLFNQPLETKDAEGKKQTFIEKAATGEDPGATLNLLTGMAVFESIKGDIFPNVVSNMAVKVSVDAEGNILDWQAAPLRFTVEGGVDRFLVQSGKRLQDKKGEYYYDQSNVLLTYAQLKKEYREDFANSVASQAAVMDGLAEENGEVKIKSPNEALQEFIGMVDSIYTKDYGVVDLPGEQEITGYLPEGQAIGSTSFQGDVLTVLNPEGNKILELQPTEDQNGNSLWLPYIEKEQIDFGDPLDYEIMIGGQGYIPGEQFSSSYEEGPNGEIIRSYYDVVTVIASEPYAMKIPLPDGQHTATLWLVDTVVPSKDYQRGEADGKWTLLAPAVVWTDMSNLEGMQAIRNVFLYDEVEEKNGDIEYTPGAVMDDALFPKRVSTKSLNIEGPVENEEYRALREQFLSKFRRGRGLAMKVFAYLPPLQKDLTNLDDPLNARIYISEAINLASPLADENPLDVSLIGNKYLTGDPSTLTTETGNVHDRIDPNTIDIRSIKNPILGLVGNGVFYDLPQQ